MEYGDLLFFSAFMPHLLIKNAIFSNHNSRVISSGCIYYSILLKKKVNTKDFGQKRVILPY